MMMLLTKAENIAQMFYFNKVHLIAADPQLPPQSFHLMYPPTSKSVRVIVPHHPRSFSLAQTPTHPHLLPGE